jgi:CBS domain containing-hemolysin-like protein
MVLLIVFFFVSIIFSFLCSIWEAVLLSITPTHVELLSQEKHPVAPKLKAFKEEIDKPLSAILTLNTVAHTVGAIGVGAQASKVFGTGNMVVAGTTLPISGEVVVAVFMTIAILYLSEIFPKTIGANNWKGLTPFTVRSLSFISFILAPAIWVSTLITKMLKKDKEKSVLSRTDFANMTQIGLKQGTIKNSESRIITNLLKFDSILTKTISTPRTVMFAANKDVTLREFYDKHPTIRFSRIPVYDTKIDKVQGYVLKDDLLDHLLKGEDTAPMSSIMRNIIVVKEDVPVPTLFNQLNEAREHIALVVGEYGGVHGVVTMEDVIETLLGLEIIDEFDNSSDMQKFARQKWEERSKAMGLGPEE